MTDRKLPTVKRLTEEVLNSRAESEKAGDMKVMAIYKGMFDSLVDFIQVMNVTTEEGFISLYKRHNNLWVNTARKVNRVYPKFMKVDGFKNGLKLHSPQFYKMVKDHEDAKYDNNSSEK